MAKNIPIWPGSASFSSGNTPYGLYDSDSSFSTDAPKVAKYCAQRLGYPIIDVELQDINFFNCFEEAVSEYSFHVNTYNIRDNMLNLYGSQTGSNLTGQKISTNFGGLIELATEYGTEAGTGGNVTYYSGSIALTANKQVYDLTDANIVSLESGTPGTDLIEIKRIFHEPAPAIAKYFDPMVGTGLGTQQMLSELGFGSMSPGVSFMMMPIYFDLLRMQAIEFNDQIRKSAFSFELHNNHIKIFPIPNGVSFTKIWFTYIKKTDRSNPLKGKTGAVSDYSNIPYQQITYANINEVGKQWIRRYACALSMLMLGWVRSKYSSLPIPNGELTLNGSDLISQGQTEKDNLLTELKEILDSLSRQAQLERKQTEADALQQQMNKIPLGIYIG